MRVMEVEALLTFNLDDFDTDSSDEAAELLKFQIEENWDFCNMTVFIREYGVEEEYDDYEDEDED